MAHLPPENVVELLEYFTYKRASSRIIKLVFCENDSVNKDILGKLTKRTKKAVLEVIPKCVQCTDYFQPAHVGLVLFEITRHINNDLRGNNQKMVAKGEYLVKTIMDMMGEAAEIGLTKCPSKSQSQIRAIIK